MKNAFLNKLAESLISKYEKQVGELCVVFPSRRAGVHFRKYLSDHADSAMWAPEIFSIQDLVAHLSPYSVKDDIQLVFELFEIYRTHVPEETFDHFYPWGGIILDDFNDIDKNLVPANEIFRIIKEHRELEDNFELNFGDYEEFAKFWKTFSSKDLSDSQKNFLRTWEILGIVYNEFRKKLIESGSAYEGMAYKELVEDIRSGKFELPWHKIIFAGFNALNKAEAEIMRLLINNKQAEIFWDADSYYTDDAEQEAGHFLRKNFRDLNIDKPDWNDNDLSNSVKSISVIGSSTNTGQVRACGAELSKLIQQSQITDETTAIILPDESLLMPLLHSLPADIGLLNVTMGYRFRYSSLHSFISLLKELQLNRKDSKNSSAYYHKYVTGLLLHPYTAVAEKGSSGDVKTITERNLIYVSAEYLKGRREAFYDLIFEPCRTAEEITSYLFGIISHLSELSENEPNTFTDFEKEFLFTLHAELNKLVSVINKLSSEITIETFWNLLDEVMDKISVPFSGEPLGGLQIMGLLETRALDFDNVFILSMNESVMPRASNQASFIPFHLRKSFRLPTFEDEDASTAYYFYRLLQKAKNIRLFYNTEPGKLSGGEKSRYIMQIEHELVQRNKKIKYQNLLLEVLNQLPARKAITITKSDEVIRQLENYEASNGFSATALTSFITCGLKFYLERIAGLKEEDDIEEFFGGATFGTIFHEVMRHLYSPYVSNKITANAIDVIKERLNNEFDVVLDAAFKQVSTERVLASELGGKNLLYKGIIQKLAGIVLEFDKQRAPFTLSGLECKLDSELNISPGREISLTGRIDRIDSSNGTATIIDYKTGRVKGDKLNSNKFEEMFSDPEYKELFQTHFYSLLYLRNNKNSLVTPAIYPLRNISDGLMQGSEEPFDAGSIQRFERGLRSLAEELFDPAKPFAQTDDTDRCKYCAFTEICFRT